MVLRCIRPFMAHHAAFISHQYCPGKQMWGYSRCGPSTPPLWDITGDTERLPRECLAALSQISGDTCRGVGISHKPPQEAFCSVLWKPSATHGRQAPHSTSLPSLKASDSAIKCLHLTFASNAALSLIFFSPGFSCVRAHCLGVFGVVFSCFDGTIVLP